MPGEQRRKPRWGRWATLALGVGVGLGLVLFLVRSYDQPPPKVVSQASPVAAATSTIRFTDVTAAAGIDFTHFAGAMGKKWYPETIGAGAGFVDYDADGWPDILLVNGAHWPAQQHGKQKTPTMRLYRNLGDGTFADVTVPAGLAIPLYGMGMAAADYDNDGDRDLLVTGYLRNLFLLNNGNGTFTEATQRVGIQDGKWSSGAAFVDYDRDGALDLVISHYVTWSPELEEGLDCTYGTPAKDYCPVRYFKGQGLTLYHNRGDGVFEDATQRAGVAAAGTRAFAPYIFDVNDDHWPDIFVTSDGTPSLLYRNQGDGTFMETGSRAGIVLDESGSAYAGMGIDATYPRNDGQLCIAIGNFVGEPTTLHCRVRQGPSYHPELFAEVSAQAGIGRPTLRSVTFGLFFFDADLDGYEDLFMVNGHVIDEAQLRHAPRAQRPQLFRNLGNGTFEAVQAPAGSGLDRALVGRGAAYADYDGDGDLDILLSQNQRAAVLLRNDTPGHAQALRVQLQGTQSNRDGIGAEVRVYSGEQVQRQTVRTGRSYYAQNELVLTFGLGQTGKAKRVEILWPSGMVDVHQDVPLGTTLHAIEGQYTGAPSTAAPSPAVAAPSPAVPSATASTTYLTHTQAGIAAYRTQQYPEAAQAFEAAKTLRPSEPLPYRYLTDIYWRQGQHAQAAATVQALAQVIPEAYFLDRMGSDYEAAELPGLANLLYREAIRVDPQLPSAHYNLGRLLLHQGKLEAGIAAVQAALRLYPDFAAAHETLGLAYTEQGRLAEAVTHLQQSLQLHPESATARNHLGRIYQAQGRLDDAIRAFRDLVEHHPDVAAARHNLAVAYARKGLPEQAVAQFQKAVRLQPDFHAAHIDLAILFIELQRPQDAIRELETVLQAQPQHADAHTYLGRLFYQLRHFDQSWQHARQAEAQGAPVADLITALQRVSVEP